MRFLATKMFLVGCAVGAFVLTMMYFTDPHLAEMWAHVLPGLVPYLALGLALCILADSARHKRMRRVQRRSPGKSSSTGWYIGGDNP